MDEYIIFSRKQNKTNVVQTLKGGRGAISSRKSDVSWTIRNVTIFSKIHGLLNPVHIVNIFLTKSKQTDAFPTSKTCIHIKEYFHTTSPPKFFPIPRQNLCAPKSKQYKTKALKMPDIGQEHSRVKGTRGRGAQTRASTCKFSASVANFKLKFLFGVN